MHGEHGTGLNAHEDTLEVVDPVVVVQKRWRIRIIKTASCDGCKRMSRKADEAGIRPDRLNASSAGQGALTGERTQAIRLIQ